MSTEQLIEDGKVRQRAAIFVDDWKGHSHKERQEAAQFEAGFLNVFLRDFSVGRLEYQIRIAGKNRQGYADLFWPSVLLLEMKSTDAPDFLDGSADEQAFKYARNLPGGQRDFPQLIVVCDFLHFRVYDMRPSLNDGSYRESKPEPVTFAIEDFIQHIKVFGPMIGRSEMALEQTRVNIEAAESLGRVYDRLMELGYGEHNAVVFLMRTLFCLFAEDTKLFQEPNAFANYLAESYEHRQPLFDRIDKLFTVLDRPATDKERKDFPEYLKRPIYLCPWDQTKRDPVLEFPFVDGTLFHDPLDPVPLTDAEVKSIIVDGCSTLDWSKVSPSIFGGMFQHARSREERRALGEHYTSNRNILKLVRPLFWTSSKKSSSKFVTSESQLAVRLLWKPSIENWVS